MARPKPTEEFDPITVRLPLSMSKKLRFLAAESTGPTGQKMSLSEFCTAILSEAADSGITIRARVSYDKITPALVANEPKPHDADR